jgi:hypothetical protein
MLFPFTRVWTRRQKGLIVSSVVLALASFGALIYGFERYYRGPSESALCGTWRFERDRYVEFMPDHKFSVFERAGEPDTMIVKGRWYAGGKFLYMRFPPNFRSDGSIFDIWHIDHISAEEIHVRYWQDGMTHVFHRVDSVATRASNHAMERTADRSLSTF